MPDAEECVEVQDSLTILVFQDRAKAVYPSAGPLSSNLTDCKEKSLEVLKAEVYSLNSSGTCIPFMVYISVLWGAKTHFKLSI